MIKKTYFISTLSGESSLMVTGTWAPLAALFGPDIVKKVASVIGLSLNNLSFM
tara:strand:+ start:14895 stop:15053 length:159 start_codon:yes stop_codon:yes gene_type:complete